MSVEQAIQGLLATYQPIVAIVADRVYPGMAPQTADFPRIEWGVLNVDPEISHQGRNPACDRYVVDVHCSSRTYMEAKHLARLVDEVFAAGATMPTGIGVILKDNETDLSEFTGSGGDQRIRTVVQQFIVWAA